LNRRDLHREMKVRRKSRLDDAMLYIFGEQLVASLRDNFAPMGEDQNALSSVDRVPNEPSRDDGLAASSGRDQQDAALTGGDGSIDIGQDINLIGT
jgi:hypothetical protein